MIEVKHLTKFYGEKLAVDDISFSVGRGEVLGFLGPNAAGKSTTMRMITGFFPPTSGTVAIGGSDIVTNSLKARKKIGYLPENAPAYPDMTVMGFLEFIAGIRGFSGAPKKTRIEETIERCFLAEVRYQPISTLSKGFKQRVCFAQSIIHDPEYLIMDEPTDGLDPNQKHEVRVMIRQMARDKTIILSTHILEEVEALCSRAIIIARGKIVADDTPSGLKAESLVHGAVSFTITNADRNDPLAHLKDIPEVERTVVVSENESRMTFRAFPKDPVHPPANEIMARLVQNGLTIDGFEVESGRLDEVFRTVTSTHATEVEK
ncbi:MAG: ATP-binding cassette domain-containing protein [Deltaproteobacteria bacterium]|jgi:ABC-2 type transport system ATP-binding protein|nr:ATP-binding cassette domain-containing protein [Deltaproteobacteria bacterium]